jgi:O-antigen/teichoic acid export membrane protein
MRALRDRLPFLVDSGYATLTAGSAGLLLILLTVAGRFLSTDDYGRFSYALALTTIVETIMDLGLSQITVRSVARDRSSAGRLFPHVLGVKLVWVAIGLALLAIIAPVLRHDPVVVRLCYALGISSAVRSYLLTARGLLQGLQRFDLEAVVVVADRLLLLVAGSAVLMAGYGLVGLAAAFVVSRVVMLGVAQILLGTVIGRVRPAYDRDSWRDIQSAALPLGFFMIALNTYTYVDTVILGLMRTDAEVGWYAAAYRVYEGLTYAPSILAAVLTPRLSYLFTHDRSGHRRLLMRSLLAALALAIVLGGVAALLATPIVTLLFGSRYAAAGPPLRILALGALFVFATWILHAAAISTNLDRRLLLTTVVGLGTNVALNVVLIPRDGISGAAWATVLAEALTALLLFVQIERRLRRRQ